MRSRSRRLGRWSGYLYLLPALALIGLFVYFPIVDNTRLSFFHIQSFAGIETFIGFDNYVRLADDPVVRTAILNNVWYAVISVIFQVGGALVLAALVETFVVPRLRGVLRTIYFLPSAMPLTVTALLFTFIYHPQLGLLNQILDALGLNSLTASWLGDQKTAIFAIIAMNQWHAIGYAMVLYLVAIQRIPVELYEAMAIDGAGRLRQFFSVTVPLVRQMTGFLTVVTVSGALLVFNEVIVMTNGGPANASQVLGTWIYKSAFLYDDRGYAAAIATIVLILALAFAAVQLTYTRRRRVEL
jgi:raffinose/stachyose/melibiose transport system permease protein